jgi:hypothetical protein
VERLDVVLNVVVKVAAAERGALHGAWRHARFGDEVLGEGVKLLGIVVVRVGGRPDAWGREGGDGRR